MGEKFWFLKEVQCVLLCRENVWGIRSVWLGTPNLRVLVSGCCCTGLVQSLILPSVLGSGDEDQIVPMPLTTSSTLVYTLITEQSLSPSP